MDFTSILVQIDQVDNYKKMIKKIKIVAGMKYAAEVSCAIELLVEISPILKLPKKPTLERAKIIMGDTIITAIPPEVDDLYKELLKTYTKKVDKFEKTEYRHTS